MCLGAEASEVTFGSEEGKKAAEARHKFDSLVS